MSPTTTRAAAPTIGFVSLGCPKALVDSERILTQLRVEGYQLVGDYQGANLVVVNTCGFIDEARAESLAAIGEALEENGRVIVTGCLGAEPETIQAHHPKVLAVTGPQQYEQVLSQVHHHLPPPSHDPLLDLVPPRIDESIGIKLTPRHYAYLKIAEGCNHRCSFCIIPSMRGRLVSRPIGEVMNEAQRLARAGVKELLVISQDTSAYGVDLRYRADAWGGDLLETRFQTLCEALSDLGIWVRLHYVYPYPHVDRVVPLMRHGGLLPYLDIPFQHASPRILKAMRRPAAAENTLERISRWRQDCPDLVIRSTFIVGFPGETDEDFELLLDWLETAQLDRVGCFQYSPVAGAAANSLPDPVPDAIKQARWERFMQTQAEISARRLQTRVGRQLQVLVDEHDGERWVARSYADAPEIDGAVYLQADTPEQRDYLDRIRAGDFVLADIRQADHYDLWANPVVPG